MQLELLMDGLAQREAALQLRQPSQGASGGDSSGTQPGQSGGSSNGPAQDVQEASNTGSGSAEPRETDGQVAKPAAAAASQQLQQQQAATALSSITAAHLPGVHQIVLQALGNTTPDLDVKNLLAPLQLNQLLLQRAEADTKSVVPIVEELLERQSNFVSLR